MPLSRGAALDYLSDRFGGNIDVVESVLSIGVAAALVVGNDPDAVALNVINLSANTLYIGLANDVNASKGILLVPSGGSMTLTLDQDMILTTREWWALASGALSAVYVQRVRRVTLAS